MHKRRLIQFALAGLAGLTIHPLAAAAASQTADEDLPLLVAGMDAAYPPFGFKDSKTGEFVGFDVDIIRAIGRTAGFSVRMFKDKVARLSPPGFSEKHFRQPKRIESAV